MEIQTFEEFAAKHGGSGITGVKGLEHGAQLFPSGAIALRHQRPIDKPVLIEPPEDGTLKNLERKKLYWTFRADAAKKVFDVTKNNACGNSGFPESAPWLLSCWGQQPQQGDTVTVLKALAALARREKRALKKIEAEIEKHPTMIARREAEERDAEYRRQLQEEAANRQSEIDAIHV